jgi:hypothetical protein
MQAQSVASRDLWPCLKLNKISPSYTLSLVHLILVGSYDDTTPATADQ